MTRYRRWLFLGLITVASLVASGCCYPRPLLFPRLHPCVGGGCGPVFPRLAVATAPVTAGPVVSGPVYDAPVYNSGPVYGGPVYGGGGVPCTNCGGHDAGYGVPIASTPPVMYGPGAGLPYAPAPNFNPNFTVPTAMPGPGASTSNVFPFDSALAPTVKPPTGTGVVGSPDSKKVMLTAGK